MNAALRHFEAAEANLLKLEQVWKEILSLTPEHIAFGENATYDSLCRSYRELLSALPKIDGWKPGRAPLELKSTARGRLESPEPDMDEVIFSMEDDILAPGRELADYRHRLGKTRRQAIESAVTDVVEEMDRLLQDLAAQHAAETNISAPVKGPSWDELETRAREVETLLGESYPESSGWGVFRRHLSSGALSDLRTIQNQGWPLAKRWLLESLHGHTEPIPVQSEHLLEVVYGWRRRRGAARPSWEALSTEPIPVRVEDLAEVVSGRPRGRAATRLSWGTLSAEGFERLISHLVGSTPGYEDPSWLARTDALDRGRDLSVYRSTYVPLAGIFRHRVIVQCRHWPDRSIAAAEVAELRERVKLWEPPRVDVLVIATTGRLTADAIGAIERNNSSGLGPRIEMWSDAHLEHVLTARPALIAELELR